MHFHAQVHRDTLTGKNIVRVGKENYGLMSDTGVLT